MQLGAYEVQADGSLVTRYTARHERELGLTHRETVGPKWVSAHDVIEADYLETRPYSEAVQKILGFRSQKALADWLEKDQG